MFNKIILFLYIVSFYFASNANLTLTIVLTFLSFIFFYFEGCFSRSHEEKYLMIFVCFAFYAPLLFMAYQKYQDQNDVITIQNFITDNSCIKSGTEIETNRYGDSYDAYIFKCNNFETDLSEQDIFDLLNIENKNSP
jgi:hypothetical protein